MYEICYANGNFWELGDISYAKTEFVKSAKAFWKGRAVKFMSDSVAEQTADVT